MERQSRSAAQQRESAGRWLTTTTHVRDHRGEGAAGRRRRQDSGFSIQTAASPRATLRIIKFWLYKILRCLNIPEDVAALLLEWNTRQDVIMLHGAPAPGLDLRLRHPRWYGESRGSDATIVPRPCAFILFDTDGVKAPEGSMLGLAKHVEEQARFVREEVLPRSVSRRDADRAGVDVHGFRPRYHLTAYLRPPGPSCSSRHALPIRPGHVVVGDPRRSGGHACRASRSTAAGPSSRAALSIHWARFPAFLCCPASRLMRAMSTGMSSRSRWLCVRRPSSACAPPALEHGWRGILAEGLASCPACSSVRFRPRWAAGLLKASRSTNSPAPCTRSSPIIPIATPIGVTDIRKRGCGRI